MRRRARTNLIVYSSSLILLGIYLSPFVWLVITSFKPGRLTWSSPPVFAFSPTLENYRIIFLERGIFGPILNSVVVTVVTVGLSLVLGSLAGYGLAKYRVGGKSLTFDFLTFFMLPPLIVIIPLFMFMKFLHLLDSLLALILGCSTFALPFVTLMMRGIFLDLPMEIIEASLIDGCDRCKAFFVIALPLELPGIIGATAICAMLTWNNYLFPLILSYEKAYTLPILLGQTITMHSIRWGEMSALGSVAVIPVVVGIVILRKYALVGLTFGAVKE